MQVQIGKMKDGIFLITKVEKNDDYKIKGNLNNINLPNKSCDLIFISHTLEHIPHIQIQNVLTEINRIMKKIQQLEFWFQIYTRLRELM